MGSAKLAEGHDGDRVADVRGDRDGGHLKLVEVWRLLEQCIHAGSNASGDDGLFLFFFPNLYRLSACPISEKLLLKGAMV